MTWEFCNISVSIHIFLPIGDITISKPLPTSPCLCTLSEAANTDGDNHFSWRIYASVTQMWQQQARRKVRLPMTPFIPLILSKWDLRTSRTVRLKRKTMSASALQPQVRKWKVSLMSLTSQMSYPLRWFRTEQCELLNQAVVSFKIACASLILSCFIFPIS